MGQIRRILVLRSTSVGRLKVKQDGSTNPDRVFSLWWGDDLDLHGWWGKCGDFLLHTVSNSWEHSGTSGKDSVGVQVFSDINIALHDGVVGGFMDTSRFHTEE